MRSTLPHISIRERIGNSQRGFTLIETFVAVFILAVSVGGPLTIISKSLSAAYFARDQISAFFLAQEAVEYIRNERDENTLSGNNWLDGFSDCLGGNTCDVDVKNDTIISCSGTCPALRFDDATGFYSHTSGITSPFVREVSVQSLSAHEAVITVDVAFRTGLLSRSFTVKEHILNWQQGVGSGSGGSGSCSSTQADDLIVDTSSASVGGPGNLQLLGMSVSNVCSTTGITITQIRTVWSNPANLTDIRIGGTTVWTGSASSGSFTDISDYTIASSDTDIINFFEFSGDMQGDTFTISFFMSDGSTKTVGPFSP